MRRFWACFVAAFMCVALLGAPAQAKEKVLLDTDMVEMFDDGIAMIMLANAPNVELMGITTVSGNSWVEEGTAYAVRQQELESFKEVPLAAGAEYPLRPQRHDNFELERTTYGMGHDSWLGSFGRPKPKTWQEFYKQKYGQLPTKTILAKHAVDFIIDTVRANPHEITIAAIGPCTNLALAIRKAPDIVPLVKRVVYMGGAFFQPGNVTPNAEYNWWFDPEAARIAVRSPFKEQVVFGLDVCEKVVFRKEHYDRIIKSMGETKVADMFKSTFVGQMFQQDPKVTHYVWDVLVAAYIIDPSLVTEETTRNIDINDQLGSAYGQSIAYGAKSPMGTQKAKIVMSVDEKKFWDMVNDTVYWKSF